MITWTKIDIGDGEAIWYSDCLEYQIIYRHSYVKNNNRFYHDAIFRDSSSLDWGTFDDLESAKKWCEEHKKNQTKRG